MQYVFQNWYQNKKIMLIWYLKMCLIKKSSKICFDKEIFKMFDLYYPFLISLFLTKRGRKFYLIWFYFDPFIDDWQKEGEVFEYICMFSLLKGEKYLSSLLVMHIWFGLQMYGDKIYDYLACCIYIHCIHIYVLYCHIHLFMSMHELRGSFFEALL